MWLRRVALAVGLAAGGMIFAAAPASASPEDCAGSFCAYDGVNLQGILIRSNAPAGTSKVDVPDDRTESGENYSLNAWEGRNRRFLWPDQSVFTWQPGTVAFNLAGGNNKIDHFDVH